MQAGDEITVECAELVAGGDGLSRIDGFPIFTPGLFPGDVAVLRLEEVKKGFARATLIHLNTPSSWRRASPCPISDECGGCDWTALRLDRQLAGRQRILIESLRRIGKFDVASLPEIAVHPSPLNYRIRSRLHRAGGATGFYALRSNRVVPLVPECEVVGVETARMFGARSCPTPAVREAADRMSDAESDQVLPWEIGGEVITELREITIEAGGFSYALSTRSFFQVNRHLLDTMLQLVRGHAEGAKQKHLAIDLYAGVGFFTVPLAATFKRVIAIEGSSESARYARLNVPDHVEIVEAPVERLASRLPDADMVFLDPPRAGARPEVVTAVSHKARELICYLSCDPVTFARDASRLTASGWRLSTLDLLDLFPNTHHVETLASFERAR